VNQPYSLKAFYSRFAAWRAAGKPAQFARDAPIASANAPATPGLNPGVIVTAGGIAFVETPGIALQVRRQVLCVRFPDGAEQSFHSRDHRLKTIILAASASVSTDAVQWLVAERVGLLIANKSLTGFSLIGQEPTLQADKNPLELRRKQFAASPLAVARHVVGIKIETFALSEAEREPLTIRLANAATVSDVIAVEARASLLYWRRWKGFELRFKGERAIPISWRVFTTRGNPTQLKSGRTALFYVQRNATNPINAMLNYAYAVMVAQIARAICGVGIDPAYGFLHADKIGRMSFAYDAIELLRARIDELVFRYAASRRFVREDFIEMDGASVRLAAKLAREIASVALRGISFHDCEKAVLTIAKRFGDPRVPRFNPGMIRGEQAPVQCVKPSKP
jgi:CRISPR-associated endonuclease Cas1